MVSLKSQSLQIRLFHDNISYVTTTNGPKNHTSFVNDMKVHNMPVYENAFICHLTLTDNEHFNKESVQTDFRSVFIALTADTPTYTAS